MIIYLIMLVLQRCAASYLYLDDAVFYMSPYSYSRMKLFNQLWICNKYIAFFLVSSYNQIQQLVHNNCIEQNNSKISMSIQHTNHHVNASVSKHQPTCGLNTQPTYYFTTQPTRQYISWETSTNMSTQYTTNISTQHTTNTSMHQLVNVNQHLDSTHNQHVSSTYNQHATTSVSKRQPTCRTNAQPTCWLNTQPTCWRQPTCPLNKQTRQCIRP